MAVPTLDEIKTFVRTSIAGTAEDALATNSVNAAIELVGAVTQRTIAVAGSSSARSYAPRPCSSILRIHDCTSVTSVVENGTTLTVAVDYQLEPIGALDLTGATVPYEQIRRLSGSTWYTNYGATTVVVTAAWGFAAIPAGIVEAIKILAKDIFDHRNVKFGLAGFDDFVGVRTRQAAIISDLERKWARVESWGIA